MDAKKKHLTVEFLLPHIENFKGNLAAVARALGVSRQTIHTRVTGSPVLQQALQDARESMLDNAESTLYSKVLGGDVTALIFFLKTQGKRRGYTERVDVNHIINEIEQELARLGLSGVGEGQRQTEGNADAGFVN